MAIPPLPRNFMSVCNPLLFYAVLNVSWMQMPAFSTTNPYLLYALTISGVAYLIKLRKISAYSSLPVLPRDEVTQFSLNDCYSSNSEPAAITSVAATAGCLAVGRIDGSAAYFQLGLLHHSTPGNRMSPFLAKSCAFSFIFLHTWMIHFFLLIRFCEWVAGWFRDQSFMGFHVKVLIFPHEMSFLILYLHALAIINPSLCLVWTKTHLKDWNAYASYS